MYMNLFLFLNVCCFCVLTPIILTNLLLNPLLSLSATVVTNHSEADLKSKDWVFINYTYKRFEGLTARGAIPSYMKSGKR